MITFDGMTVGLKSNELLQTCREEFTHPGSRISEVVYHTKHINLQVFEYLIVNIFIK